MMMLINVNSIKELFLFINKDLPIDLVLIWLTANQEVLVPILQQLEKCC